MRKLFFAAAVLGFAATPASAQQCAVVKLNSLKAIKYSESSDNSVIKAFTTLGAAFGKAQGASTKEIGKGLTAMKDPEPQAVGLVVQQAGATEEAFAAAMEGIPGLISAIDAASDTPDDLYLTLSTEGDNDASFWPAMGEDEDQVRTESVFPTQGPTSVVPYVLGLQPGAPGKEITVNFFDWDGVGNDDHLGSITFTIEDVGEGPQSTAVFGSKNGGSMYVVNYDVVGFECSAIAPMDAVLKSVYESSKTKGATPVEATTFAIMMLSALPMIGPHLGDYAGQM